MQELMNIGLCETPDEVVAEALAVSRKLIDADATLAAVATDGGLFEMSGLNGVTEPALLGIPVTVGVGLGGRVLTEGSAITTEDYTTEPTISAHYKPAVKRAGLHGLSCAASVMPGGTGLLLYAARHEIGAPGDRATEILERVAEVAALSLHQLAERRRRIDLEVLQERQRLACSLHDSVAQMLFAIGVSAQQSQRESDPKVLASALGEIEQTAAGARAELREVFARLTEPLPGLALEALLDAEGRLFARASGCRVVVTRDGDPRRLTDLHEALLVDVAREGLRNAVKHSEPRLAVVHLSYEPDAIVLSVQAEVSLPIAPFHNARSERRFSVGSGLDILSRRAAQLGGELTLTFGESSEAVLVVHLPGAADRHY